MIESNHLGLDTSSDKDLDGSTSSPSKELNLDLVLDVSGEADKTEGDKINTVDPDQGNSMDAEVDNIDTDQGNNDDGEVDNISIDPDEFECEDEDEVNKNLSKTEKLEKLIDRLGYSSMNMQIFHKMRETFGHEECEFCGKLFYNKNDFDNHMRTHTGLLKLSIMIAIPFLLSYMENYILDKTYIHLFNFCIEKKVKCFAPGFRSIL